jgi:hypothetical protein
MLLNKPYINKTEMFAFLTLALDGGEWLASHPGHLTPGEKPQLPTQQDIG